MLKIIIFIIYFLFFATHSFADEEQQKNIKTLKLGVMNFYKDEPKQSLQLYKRLTEQLTIELNQLNANNSTENYLVSLFIADTFNDLMQRIEVGEIDLVMSTSLIVLSLQKQLAFKPILIGLQNDEAEYYSIIFVKKESNIYDIQALKGKTIAFDTPYSVSSYALPYAFLKQQGLILNFSKDVSLKDNLHYLFAEDKKNIAFWVLLNKTDAGALSPDDFTRFVPPKIQEQLRPIAKTPSTLRWLICANANLEINTINKINQAFLNLRKSIKGQIALKKANILDFKLLQENDNEILERTNQLFTHLPKNN